MTSNTPEAPHSGNGRMPVITVDDNPMIGEVIKVLISNESDLRYVQHFVSGSGVMEAIEREGVKAVVLDYEIPGTDTLALLRQITETCPACKVMMLSAHARPEFIRATLRAGAAAYALKSDDPQQIMQTLRKVAANAP